MRLSPITDDGARLDATFEVEKAAGGIDVVFHSRGGGSRSQAPVNAEYFPALELLLSRLALLGARIASITVDSSVARKLPWSERVLPMKFPIDLAHVGDFNTLRIEIARMQPDIARSPDAKAKGGNSHKRIRISLDVPSNISLLVLSTILVVGEKGYIVGYRPTPHKGGSSII